MHTYVALITEISVHLKNNCHILITALITFKHYTIVKSITNGVINVEILKYLKDGL